MQFWQNFQEDFGQAEQKITHITIKNRTENNYSTVLYHNTRQKSTTFCFVFIYLTKRKCHLLGVCFYPPRITVYTSTLYMCTTHPVHSRMWYSGTQYTCTVQACTQYTRTGRPEKPASRINHGRCNNSQLKPRMYNYRQFSHSKSFAMNQRQQNAKRIIKSWIMKKINFKKSQKNGIINYFLNH